MHARDLLAPATASVQPALSKFDDVGR